jgi:transposase
MGLVRNQMVRTKEKWEYNYASKLVEAAATVVTGAVRNALNPKMPNHKMPKFKKKKNQKMSFSFYGIKINDNNELIIPKPSKSKLSGVTPENPISFSRIKLGEKLRFQGNLTGVTISCNRNGKWFVGLTVRLDEEGERKHKLKFDRDRTNKPECGIDANIRGFHYNELDGSYADWETTSEEIMKQYGLIKYYSRGLTKKRLKNENWKQSKTYAKMRTKLSKSYARAYNLQEENLNKFIQYLNNNYSSVTIEDLDVNSMKMNRRMCKSLHRAMFGRFKQKSETKFNQTNIEFIKADRFYPSTQRCSNCGMVKTGEDKLGLSGDKHGNKHNEYKCFHCNIELDRDDNAVENLIQYKKYYAKL